MRIIEQRLDLALEVTPVGWIYFRRNLEWHSDALGNFNGAINSFLRGRASEKGQIVTRFEMKPKEIVRQAMIDRRLPVCGWPGRALRIRDRDHWDMPEALIQT